jgi:hypothetical protein
MVALGTAIGYARYVVTGGAPHTFGGATLAGVGVVASVSLASWLALRLAREARS